MATNENLIPIPGRLHSVATEGHVAGADEIFDDSLNKDQATINQEVNEAIGTGGSVDSRISAAINALDASISKSAGEDGLALSVTEENGKITAINGSIAENTYDTYGSASAAQSAAISAAATDATTKVNAAKAEIKGNATSGCDTLGKAEALISTEKTRAQEAEQSLDGRVDTLEDAVGTGGSVDSRISAAVATEATRAQGAESTLQTNIDSEATRAQAAESALNSGKADKATTLAGYGITDAYTKSETYTKTEVNGLVDTPHQEYVTVDVYANLPATGSKDTIYRVSNYNGSTSQVDASVYSEYAWNGTQYIFLCVKSQIGEVFDISVYNNNAKYANLAEALNGGANIPQSLQKGGMSVKFVQSSDNKYVQCRLMADSWSINTNDWSFCGYDVYVENPEWIYVLLDAEKRILAGLKSDGSVEWSIGIPTPVKTYIDNAIAEIKNGTEGTDLDGLNKIITFFSEFSTSDTLKDLLNTKVDKEEGKSLVDAEYAEGVHYIENPEFAEVKVDAEDKVLEATEKDGTKLFGSNVKVLGSIDINGVNYKVINNPEWLKVVLDSEDRIICGIKADGRFVVYIADFLDDIEAIKIRLKELDAYSVIKNPEFMEVELDADDKILGGRKVDGTKFENNDVELNSNATVSGSLKVDGVVIKNIEDPEGRHEITTDSEDKIISYRKEDGTKVENVGIETNNLTLTEEGMTNFKQALKDAGFNPYSIDITQEKNLYVNRPKYAQIYLYGDLPTDTSDTRTPTNMLFLFCSNEKEVFKANATLSIQGHGSAHFAKHGYTLNLLNDKSKKLSVKFGDMIAADSFHLKGYMDDASHSRGIGCAALWRDMIAQLDYPYCKINNVPSGLHYNTNTDSICTADAKYSEDGFPVGLYVNDDFYGLYTIKLKKGRSNYAMEKSVKQEIFLDSITYTAFLNESFNYADWEVKNPKINNYEEGGEITDQDVLSSINRLFGFTSDIDNTYQNHEDYIVLPHWIIYVILCELILHSDTNGNNTELCTWDGLHWSILPYDMDWTLYNIQGGYIMQDNVFFTKFRTYYEPQIKSLYTSLRKSGFITTSNLFKYFKKQTDNIPRNIYEADREKWDSYRHNIWGNSIYNLMDINYIYDVLNRRIVTLDQEWLITE